MSLTLRVGLDGDRLTFTPYSLGSVGVAPAVAVPPLERSRLKSLVDAVESEVLDLVRAASVGEKPKESGLRVAVDAIAKRVLPGAGLPGLAAVDPPLLLDLADPWSKLVPWEAFQVDVVRSMSCLVRQDPPAIDSTAARSRWLIVADPLGDLCAPDADPHGVCWNHAEDLYQALRRAGYEVEFLSGSMATIEEVVTTLEDTTLAGCYFFCHGVVDKTKVALQLADGLLYAEDLARLRTAAGLFFVNACWASSATVSEVERLSVVEALAFGRLDRISVGPRWPVVNLHAAQYAREFFEQTLVCDATFGEALQAAARASLRRYEQGQPDGAWASYRAYGLPETSLLRPARWATDQTFTALASRDDLSRPTPAEGVARDILSVEPEALPRERRAPTTIQLQKNACSGYLVDDPSPGDVLWYWSSLVIDLEQAGVPRVIDESTRDFGPARFVDALACESREVDAVRFVATAMTCVRSEEQRGEREAATRETPENERAAYIPLAGTGAAPPLEPVPAFQLGGSLVAAGLWRKIQNRVAAGADLVGRYLRNAASYSLGAVRCAREASGGAQYLMVLALVLAGALTLAYSASWAGEGFRSWSSWLEEGLAVFEGSAETDSDQPAALPEGAQPASYSSGAGQLSPPLYDGDSRVSEFPLTWPQQPDVTLLDVSGLDVGLSDPDPGEATRVQLELH